MRERIAVAIDFSPHAEIALEEAISLARRVGGEVHMLHVCERCEDDPDDSEVQRLSDELRQEAREDLAELHGRYDGHGASLYQVLLEGDPTESLCDAASELGCSTIIIGTHGRTGLRRFFLGSIAEKVARLAPIDVLVARGTRRAGGYERILIPTDFSPAADRALARAVAVAAPGAHLELLHVWRLPGQLSLQYATASSHAAAVKRIVARTRKEAREKAALRIASFDGADLAIEFVDAHGSEGRTILDRAGGRDLIAVGTHGRTGLDRFALGSVAERIIRHAPCSVLATHAVT